MKINADLTKRATAHVATTPWVQSPMAGVERRMLDRMQAETGHATSYVRFAPESHFSPHVHDGGEEFLVLEGVFQDEHGDFPAGSYIRNPPTSSHTPGAAEGCVIFVKLWQFDPADRTHVRVSTDKQTWLPAGPNVEAKSLYKDAREDVRLERWAQDSQIATGGEGGEEIVVLSGSFTESGEVFTQHSWLRSPAGHPCTITTGPNGATVWVKRGHLPS
ncbi:MAG: cupin domain-containing protein [Pikeienuella sp.]